MGTDEKPVRRIDRSKYDKGNYHRHYERLPPVEPAVNLAPALIDYNLYPKAVFSRLSDVGSGCNVQTYLGVVSVRLIKRGYQEVVMLTSPQTTRHFGYPTCLKQILKMVKKK